MKAVRIHALGSRNLLSKAGCERMVRIIQSYPEDHQVVVLAPLLDESLELSSLLRLAEGRDEKLWSVQEQRFKAWNAVIEELLPIALGSKVMERIKQGFSDIEDILKSVWIVGESSSAIVSHLEALIDSWVADLVTHWTLGSEIDAQLAEYSAVTESLVARHRVLYVYGTLPQGEAITTETLRSEYAASLLASKLKANGVTFWNNSSLLKSADEREVPSAKVIRSLSYAEASELSFFGFPIIDPQALLPAINEKIAVELRYWDDESDPGSTVSVEGDAANANRVKGFSIMHNVALINIVGGGMSGVVGVASRLFSAMREAGISVTLISQASSEYSICFAVPEAEMERAEETARAEFADELDRQLIQSIEKQTDLAILAAVGARMTGQAGIAGKFFSSLGRAGVNVIAIAQGSSETNISAVIRSEDSKRALRALHARFFLSKQAISVGLIGPGSIGSTLLDQIAKESVRLKEQFGLDIHIRGIANSRTMLLDQEGIDPAAWKKPFEASAVAFDLDRFLSHIGATYFPHSLIIDCTSSDELALCYKDWMERGIHVITPNKKAGTAPMEYYHALFATALRTGRRFLYETTVGAALPVIGTLQDLVQTGDRIHRIEGVVSGTLAWLFSTYDATVPFSTLVRQAKEMGYTEPDPRDDLSGMDVGRKVVILAREIGWEVEVDAIPIDNLVPESLLTISLDAFMERLEELDPIMEAHYKRAASEGKQLRYVGTVDEEGNCSASLKSFENSHPFVQAGGTDNVICFTTDRYRREQPLVVQGPGAGREVTAGGVFSDILRLGAYLGARL